MAKKRRKRRSKPQRKATLQIGRVLVEPPEPPDPPREPREPRPTLKALRLALDNPAASADELDAARRHFPRLVLAHPIMDLLSLEDPERWKEIATGARLSLAADAWHRVEARMKLADFRRLTVATLRRAAPQLDEEITPPGQPSGTTMRIAHLLEAVLDGQVSRLEARELLRAGVTGGPPPVRVETSDRDQIDDNRHTQELFRSAFTLIVGPAAAQRVPVLDVRVGRNVRGRKRRRFRIERKYEPQGTLWRISHVLATTPADRLTELRWRTLAARAILRGKPLPA